MLNLFFLVCLFLYILYKFWTSSFNYWKERGIPYVPGRFPFGSKYKLPLFLGYGGYILDEVYNELAPHPYGGFFFLRSPVLLIRHPDAVKRVLVKDFSHFSGRLMIKKLPEDPLSHHLFNLEGEKWKILRTKLTPTFTSGKLKAMFPMFVTCCESLENLLLTMTPDSIDVKDISSRFSLDVIGTCAFGLDINSVKNPGSEFSMIREKMIKLDVWGIIKFLIVTAFPNLIEYILPRFTTLDTEKLVMKVVNDAIEYREKNNLKLNDFLSLIIELKHEGYLDVQEESEIERHPPIEMDLNLIAAQCFIFFAAGFETSSSVQSFCLYELALHPEIQERLIKEIDSVTQSFGGVTYDSIKKMHYLHMVVSETIRKYPTLPSLTRRCVKDISLGEGLMLEADTTVVLPIWSLHHDPQYFPNPDSFDPERFSPENIDSIVPFTYLPFGEGPRICIGQRFGLLQTKMGLITVLRKFKMAVTDETVIPLKLHSPYGLTAAKTPIKLRFVPRK